MVLSATAIGALLGLGTQMYSNALRKLPYMRHPWEHVLGMGLGVVFVNSLLKWETQLEQDLDKMLEKAKAANERRYIGCQAMLLLAALEGDSGISAGMIDAHQSVSVMWMVRYVCEKKGEGADSLIVLDMRVLVGLNLDIHFIGKGNFPSYPN
ncbi:complex I subunit [Sesbania bispinosa]|nr:complex I subunit [Sesbania bispinosa]